LPNNTILLVTIDKFDPNPILVNINKLKPYKFIANRTLQLVLTKPSDLVMDDPIQTKELEPLPVELKDFQPIEFKTINNHLTHGSVKGTNVTIHYYHDVHIEDNNVTIRNDQNDTFSEALIDIYILKVYNPKGHVYSQPHDHYQLK
jgi:hypothetical protein